MKVGPTVKLIVAFTIIIIRRQTPHFQGFQKPTYFGLVNILTFIN